VLQKPIHINLLKIITGSIARSATCRYLIYSEADFEVFAPQGRHVAPIGALLVPLLHTKFHPNRCKDKGVGPQKLKSLLRFDQNVEYKCPAGAYPLGNFHNICRVCTTFQDSLGVKIWLDLLEGLWSHGGFKLRGSGFPQIFSAPSGKTMRQTRKRFRGARTCWRSSVTMSSLVGLGFHPPPGWPKTLSFFICLSVCLFVRHAFERQRLCARFHHEGVGVQKRF